MKLSKVLIAKKSVNFIIFVI